MKRGAKAPAPAIDRYLLPAGRAAANPPAAVAAVDRWDGQTGRGQTDNRPFHRPYSAFYAGSVNNVILIEQRNEVAPSSNEAPKDSSKKQVATVVLAIARIAAAAHIITLYSPDGANVTPSNNSLHF